jgi:peptidoglycan/LPS O-acetylase OafA/YrhL
VEQISLPRIPEIEGLRAIAIVLVVLYHFDLPVSGGFFGVDLFFAVSGFVIARQLLHTIHHGDLPTNESLRSKLAKFYRRRSLRLLPNALAVSVFAVVGSLIWPSVFGNSSRTIANALAGLAGIGNWYGIRFPDIGVGEARPLIHMWSLSIEEQFYLVLPLAVLPWRKRGRLAAAVFGSVAILVAIAAAIADVGVHGAFFSTWSRIAPIGMGVLVAVLLSSTNSTRWLQSPPLRTIALFGLLTILGVLALTTHWNETWLTRGGYVGVGLLCALIVLFCALGNESPIGSVLRSKASQFVANRSYAIYLWHFPVAFMFASVGRVPQMLLRLVVTSVLTEVSLRLIERPARSTNRVAIAKYAPVAMVAASASLLVYWRFNRA